MSHTLFNDVTVEQQETVVGGFLNLQSKRGEVKKLGKFIKYEIVKTIQDVVEELKELKH
ncbi:MULTISPECIES: hypothetical protein [Nostocales]|jgi:hypothetical protein|uniref:hypothetical protein n=1 Tax=Nostocales TaxID=1161 RepID=UPI001444D5FC|nr:MULTISPECIES: hypothetical protein [Nostocales]MBO1064965.1 hypothetical protein [Anabaena sp. 54]